MNKVGERAKLALLCFLLLLMLGVLVFTTVNTMQAARNFQEQYSDVKTGDLDAIHPWMTMHVISNIYHIPEDYLYRSLSLDNPGALQHATLYQIANRKRQPVEQVIHTIQHAILTYRQAHPTPTPRPKTGMRRPSATPGRKRN